MCSARLIARPALAGVVLLSVILMGYGGESFADTRSVVPKPAVRSVRLNNYNNWWFTGASTDSASRLEIVARRDNVCYTEAATWTGVTPQSIKAINPSAKVYQIYILMVKRKHDTDWAKQSDLTRMVTPLTKAQIDANNWWLRDGNGRIVHEPGEKDSRYLDVGKPGFKEAYLKTILSRQSGKGFDGVVFDYWWPYIESILDGAPRPAAYPTDEDWFYKAWHPFISYVTHGLRKAGYRVIGNCAGEFNWGHHLRAWQRTKVDGNIYEQWALDWDGKWLDGATVERRISAFAQDPLEAWTADFGLRKSDPLYDQKQRVGLAMYYIAIPLSQSKRSYSHHGDAGVLWEPIWNFDIGSPVGMPRKELSKCFWSRRFSQGLVLLNYESAQSVTYTLDRAYQTPAGDSLSGTVTVPAHTGLILKTR